MAGGRRLVPVEAGERSAFCLHADRGAASGLAAAPPAELGLFAEQFDPTSGRRLGNTPQAFTHIGLINAGLRLADQTAEGTRRP